MGLKATPMDNSIPNGSTQEKSGNLSDANWTQVVLIISVVHLENHLKYQSNLILNTSNFSYINIGILLSFNLLWIQPILHNSV